MTKMYFYHVRLKYENNESLKSIGRVKQEVKLTIIRFINTNALKYEKNDLPLLQRRVLR
jgi:hypothetical protein